MPTTLARLASVPQASAMPESVELIHCQTAGQIVGVRLADGTRFLLGDPESRLIHLHASESAIPYRLGTQVEKDLTEAVDAAEEEGADLLRDRLCEMETENDAAYLDAATWKQRAARLADELVIAYQTIADMTEGTQ